MKHLPTRQQSSVLDQFDPASLPPVTQCFTAHAWKAIEGGTRVAFGKMQGHGYAIEIGAGCYWRQRIYQPGSR